MFYNNLYLLPSILLQDFDSSASLRAVTVPERPGNDNMDQEQLTHIAISDFQERYNEPTFDEDEEGEDAEESVSPEVRKMAPLAKSVADAAEAGGDLTKDNDEVVKATSAAASSIQSGKEFKAYVDRLPNSGTWSLVFA